MPLQNLVDFNSDEFKVFLDSFDHVFSDCDGVIWTRTPLPGVGDFFRLMKEHGKTVDFVSNNSLRSSQNYKDLFDAAGVENGVEHLTIPSIAVAEYLKSLNFTKKVYCVATPEAIKVLQSYGFDCVYGPNTIEVDNYETYFLKFLKDDEEIGAVVFDSDLGVNLAKIYRASTYITRPDVHFIAGATDRCFIFKSGRFDISPAAFIALMEEQTKRRAQILGKPAKLFGEFAMKRAGVTDPSRVLFIGDMIEQDVGLGKQTGFKTLLLLTNISEEQMRAHKIQPDYYAPSLNSLVPKLQN